MYQNRDSSIRIKTPEEQNPKSKKLEYPFLTKNNLVI